MRCRLFFWALVLGLLCAWLSSSQESVTLTMQEYDQIVTSLMSAQKSLVQSEAQVRKLQTESEQLRKNLEQLSRSLRTQDRAETRNKLLIGFSCFAAGTLMASSFIYLASR